MVNLEYLGLSNAKLRGDWVSHVACLRTLRFLDLSGTNIGDDSIAELGALSNLQHLWLNQTALGDRAVEVMIEMSSTHLIDVAANDTHITRAGMERLTAALTLSQRRSSRK